MSTELQDTIGLSSVMEPENGNPLADIIFIHGLGGRAQSSHLDIGL